MATERFANNAQTALTAAITAGATSLAVASASAFPTAGQFRALIDSEILLVTAVSGTTFTVTRGQEGTSAASHANGATVTLVLTDGGLEAILPRVCEGRLTLQSGTAVPTADQAAKTTVYFTPYQGNRLALYDGTRWRVCTFAETSVAVPATTTTPFDVFAYDNNGTLALETVNWTNDTTRATALTTQDGVLVKSGAATRRYLGTCRTTGSSGQTEDSTSKRFLWNYYHRVRRFLKATEATDSWTYTTAAYRAANGNTTAGQARVEFVLGVAEDAITAEVCVETRNDTGGQDAAVGIGLDSTTASSAVLAQNLTLVNANDYGLAVARYEGLPAAGYHYLQWLEYSTAAGITTWFGDGGVAYQQSGLVAAGWF